MHDVNSSGATLQQLKHLGVELAVDDFGTGYSSLSYLSQFPIDVLKIDQSFVRDINSANCAIVSAIINMSASLKQRVIAEGVEKDVQLEFLRAQQCNEAQGYLFSRPVPATQFTSLLTSRMQPRRQW